MEVKPITKEVSTTYEETIDKLRELMINEGFNILGEKKMEKMIKEKLGEDLPFKYTILLGCNPEVSKKALEINSEIGLLFPCSFVVSEKEGVVSVSHLSIMKTAILLGFAQEEEMQEVLSILSQKTTNIFNSLS